LKRNDDTLKKQKIYILCIILLCIGLYTKGNAEYYQYTDKDGNLCFTDNKAEIPKNRLDQAKSFPSLKSGNSVDTSSNKEFAASKSDLQPDDTTWNGKMKSAGLELERMHKELSENYNDLEKRKKKLESRSKEDMTEYEKKAFENSLINLNRKIKAYHKKRKHFNAEIEAFNKKLYGKEL